MRSEHIFHILSLLAFVAALILVPWWTVDDAFISYRYGRNLAETGQLTWNVGGEAVEGYSGILLPMLAAFFLKVGLPVVEGMKLLGLVAGLGTAWLMRLLMLRMGVRREIAAGGVLMFLLAPIVYVHALSGLETSFFVFLIVAFVYLLAVGMEKENAWGTGAMLGVVGMLCVLARPEGLMWVGAPLVVALSIQRKRGMAFIKRSLLLPMIILLMGSVLYFYWKWNFYGSLLPNTYYAKQFPGTFNLDSLFQAAKFGGYYLFFPFLAAGIFWFSAKKTPIHPLFKLVLGTLAICFSITLFAYLRSQLFMNYGSRFFFPFLPFSILVSAYAINLGWSNPGKTPSKLLTILLLVLGTAQVFVYGYRLQIERTFLKDYVAVMEQEWKPVAEYLSKNLPPGAKVALYQDAGWIAYSTEFECIDFGRLNDRYLAVQQPGPQAAADYFFNQNAVAAVFTSFERDTYSYHEEGELIQARLWTHGYRLAATFSNDRDYPYHQFVYLRD